MESIAETRVDTHKILVVDDDAAILKALLFSLEDEGYYAYGALSGKEALRMVYEHHPDLVILDVLLPDIDGLETCRRIRDVADIPVLMLTGMSTEEDVVKGLEAGADDYVIKPFGIKSLLARVHALLRRAELPPVNRMSTKLVVGDLEMDLPHRRVTLCGRPVKLTPTEFRLLSCLMQRPGETLSHHELLTRVWGAECADQVQYLKLYIGYLRRKIEDNPHQPTRILSERGFGYYLNDTAG